MGKRRELAGTAIGAAAGLASGAVTGNPEIGLAAGLASKRIAEGIIKDTKSARRGILNVAHAFHSGKATRSIRDYISKVKSNPSRLVGDVGKLPSLVSKGLKKSGKIAGRALEHASDVGDIVSVISPEKGRMIKETAGAVHKQYKNASDMINQYNQKAKDIRDSVYQIHNKSSIAPSVSSEKQFG